MAPSPYSSLNNTGIYDNFGASNKAFPPHVGGSGYDNVSQVDKWLKDVEYNLDKAELAVEKHRGGQGAGAAHAHRGVVQPTLRMYSKCG